MKNTYIRQENQNHQDFREFSIGKATHPAALLAASVIIGLTILAIHIQSEKMFGIGIDDLFVGFLKASFIGVVTCLCIICMTAFVTTVTPTPMKKMSQTFCGALCILCFSYIIVCHIYGLYVMAPLKMEFRLVAQERIAKKDPAIEEKIREIINRRNKQLAEERLSAKQVEWLADGDGSVRINDCYFPIRIEKLMTELKVVSADSKKQQ